MRAGSAQISQQGGTTLVNQGTQKAVIDWRSFGIGASESVRFAQPSSSSATLNRVTGEKVSLILGRLDANGQVYLINPNGIVFGKGSQVNVAGLIASTANIANSNFLQGKLVFDQPGKPGAGIANYGTITAAEGGLIALVAPHVRNDGLIQARLGRVLLGAADTFTIDLYGDGLINLALSDESLAQLKSTQGEPVKSLVTQAGTIDVGAGKAVLVTAEAAKGVLDSLINMSGTILADSASQQGGKIVLTARGGNAEVSGTLSASGTTGGLIEVLGKEVHLASTANIDASGLYGGGIIRVGGPWQGLGETYRSLFTQVDTGAWLSSSATIRGGGGEVIIWSDGNTSFAGSIFARGTNGDGGRIEVSGKGTLYFNGPADAGALNGSPGKLLLDPYDFTIGLSEAGLIAKVLRTGTSTTVSAGHDIFVNSMIDGRGRSAGGGLTLSAGNSININDYIVTNNGAINLFAAAGTVNLLAGKVVYAGAAPITVRTGSTLFNAPYLTSGQLSLISTGASVNIDTPIEAFIGNLVVQANSDVNINQPIVNLSNGSSVNISAGHNVNVNAQIEGRPGLGIAPNGAVVMTAANNINLNKSIIANTIDLTATSGTITAPTMKAGMVTEVNGIPQGEGLFSSSGPISVTTGSDLSSGIYVTTGPVSLRSTSGNVNVDTKLAEILGNVSITADKGSVNINREIANIRSGRNLTITAGTGIDQNSQIDALNNTTYHLIDPIAGGAVSFTAGNNINLNRDLATYNGPVNLTATNGILNIAWDTADSRTYRVQSGSAPITVITGGNLNIGSQPVPKTFPYPSAPAGVYISEEYLADYISGQLNAYVPFSTTGKLSLTSTGGDVTVNAPITKTTGEVSITAGNAIVVNQKVLSNNRPITLTSGTGGITVNDIQNNYGLLTEAVVTPAIDSGSAPLTLRTGGDVSVTLYNGISGKKLTIDSRGEIKRGLVSQHASFGTNELELIGDKGIRLFYAGSTYKISATSSQGSISLGVEKPGILTINAALDVSTGGLLGEKVTINAGRDINLSDVVNSGILNLAAGSNANLNSFNYIKSLNVTAGNDIIFKGGWADPTKPTSYTWFEGTIRHTITSSLIWITGGDLTATSTGGNIKFVTFPDPLSSSYVYRAIHIDGQNNLTLNAYKSVELGLIETLGPVSITAQTGNITLYKDIGPPIQFYFPSSTPGTPGTFYPSIYGTSSFDPNGTGVASLTLNAPNGIISMQGAHAAGAVNITAAELRPANIISSGTADGVTIYISAKATPNYGTSSVGTPVYGPTTITGNSFGTGTLVPQAQIIQGGHSESPILSPGPSVNPPSMPIALTALPAQPPGISSVAANSIPEASGGSEIVSNPETEALHLAGNVQLSEIIPVEEEKPDEDKLEKNTIKVPGGRSYTKAADFGR